MNAVLFDTSDRYLKMALFQLPDKETASKKESIESSQPKIFFEKLEISDFDGFYRYWNDLMKSARVKTDDLKYIFVNRGPGSFIGLRLSVMVAKTLAYLTKASLYGFDSFDMLQEGLGDKSNDEKNYLMVKPMFRSNFFFTLVNKSIRLSEIKKLEMTSVNLNRLLLDEERNELRNYLNQHLSVFDKNTEKIYTVAYKSKDDLTPSLENWEANVDVLIDYDRALFEQFIEKIIRQFDKKLTRTSDISIDISKISSAFDLTPIYV